VAAWFDKRDGHRAMAECSVTETGRRVSRKRSIAHIAHIECNRSAGAG